MASAESQSLIGNATLQQSIPWPKILGGVGLLTAGIALGAGGMYGFDHMKAPQPIELATPGEDHPFSEDRICGTPDSYDWEKVSTIDVGARTAIKKMMSLLDLERETCELGPMPALPFDPVQFENGQKSDGTYIHIHHKFTPSCKEETYKLHAYVPSEKADKKETSFITHLFHSIEDDRWELLKSSPDPCYIESGVPASPDIRSTDNKDVKEFAEFAVAEMQLQQKHQACLPETGKLELVKIQNAVTRLMAGFTMDMLLTVKAVPPSGESKEATVKVRVLQECDVAKDGVCVKKLVFPDGDEDACSAMANIVVSDRRLADSQRFGYIPADPTDMKLAKRKHFTKQRYLRAVKERPLMGSRYLKRIRRCNVDKGLTGKEQQKRRLLEGANSTLQQSVARGLEDSCEDDPDFLDGYTGSGGERDCKWYAKEDPGCKIWYDFGQLSNCKKACGRCPDLSGDTSKDPWNDAEHRKKRPGTSTCQILVSCRSAPSMVVATAVASGRSGRVICATWIGMRPWSWVRSALPTT
mmetsp:Transcript_56063/g.119358  ORF Transcript_56063/g.119358 Transcript_56063/m.119358 type:complete len:526 (+) Transcript_56063:99-1676(+)